jgi:hypothetical protein
VLLKDLLSSRYHLIRLMPDASLLRVPPDTLGLRHRVGGAAVHTLGLPRAGPP